MYLNEEIYTMKYKVSYRNKQILYSYLDNSFIRFMENIKNYQQEKIDFVLARDAIDMYHRCQDIGNTMYILNEDKEALFKYRNYIAQIYYKVFEFNTDNNNILEGERYNAGDSINGYVAADMLFSAIISKDFRLAKNYSNILYNLSDYDKRPCGQPYDFISYILKAWLNDDTALLVKNTERLKKFRAQKTCKMLFRYIIDIILAINERDENELHRQLEELSKSYKKMVSHFSDEEKYFNRDAVALAIMAKKMGMNVTINTPVIPAELLDITEIHYESLENIDFSISKEDFNTLCSLKIERMIKEAHTNIKIIKKHLEEDEENREFHIELINNQKNKIQSAKILEETKKDILKNWDNIGYLQAINKISKWFLFGQNK